MASVPWTQLLAVASEAGLPAPGVGVQEDPHCTFGRGQGGQEAYFPGVGAPRARPAPPLARLLTQTASPGALSLPPLSSPISWKQAAVRDHLQGFTRLGAVTGVNTLGQDRRTHEGAVPSCPRHQGRSTSAWPSMGVNTLCQDRRTHEGAVPPCPRHQGRSTSAWPSTGVNTLGQDRRTHEGAVPPCPRHQGRSTSAWPSTGSAY